MNGRREALFGRYQARSVERIGRMRMLLAEMAGGRSGAGAGQELSRELHTLKGDSVVVLMPGIAGVAHAAEDRLVAAGTPVSERDANAIASALAGLEAIVKDPFAAGAEGELALLQSNLRLSVDAHAPPPAVIADSPASPAPGAIVRWTSVPAHRIDDLCERIYELASAHRELSSALDAPLREWISHGDPLAHSVGEALQQAKQNLDASMDAAWSLRLIPLGPALEELVAHAQALALEQGKSLRVIVNGNGTELERSTVDALSEPLLHLVRNAVDHGIERPDARVGKPSAGTLSIEAHSAGACVSIVVRDDGRGIDVENVRRAAVRRGLLLEDSPLSHREALDLLFHHGFSTRDSAGLTSGRGIGLDVVRESLREIGGTVALTSVPGEGSCFELVVPATITRERVLLLQSAGGLYGISSSRICEVLRVAGAAIERNGERRMLRRADELMPLDSLSSSMGGVEVAEPWIVVLDAGDRRWAFSIESVEGEQDLIRRPIDRGLSRIAWIAATAIAEDGRLVVLLSTPGLVYPAIARRRI